MIMNSCMSTLLSACAPPLMMFIIGTGKHARVAASGTDVERQLGVDAAAAALATASETARIALAPRRDFVRRAVELDHALVERRLVVDAASDERLANLAVDVGDGLE